MEVLAALRGWVDGVARLIAVGLRELPVELAVGVNVLLRWVVGGVAAHIAAVGPLPDAHVIHVHVPREVAPDGVGPAIPAAEGNVHHDGRGLRGEGALGRVGAVGLLVVGALGAHRVAPEALLGNFKDEHVLHIEAQEAVLVAVLPLHAVGAVLLREVVEGVDTRRERVCVRRSPPVVVGEARGDVALVAAEDEAVVPGVAVAALLWHLELRDARLRIDWIGGGQVTKLWAEVGGNGGPNLEGAHEPPMGAVVRIAHLHEVHLRGAAALVWMQARARVGVTARDALLGPPAWDWLPLVLLVALLHGEGPQSSVRGFIDGTTEVAKDPDGGPEAQAQGELCARLYYAAREAKLVPRLDHAACEGLVHRFAEGRIRDVVRRDAHGVHGVRVLLPHAVVVALVGGLHAHHCARVAHRGHRIRRVAARRRVSVVRFVQRGPALILTVREVAAQLLKLIGEDELVLDAVAVLE
mmetsp:Transcript_21459/g.63336  ORF Transcript_21459/g.63336 Transcript_21459/m.63336 type:complete len:468 (+) Transcript_21459:395-1798(+)